MLSPRQDNFCLEYAACGNATEAYTKAYGTKKEATAAVNASKLLRNAKIKARLNELTAELKGKKIADVAECQEILTTIARNAAAADADRIKAIHVLFKVQGAYVTQIQFKSTPVVITGGEQLED